MDVYSGLWILPPGASEDIIFGRTPQGTSSATALPLRGVDANVHMVDLCAEVVLTQRYHNTMSYPVEAIYVFPVDERAAVCGFEAQIGTRVVVGDVREKQEARATYEAAKAQGHGAYLLEECREDVFRFRVGNIPAGETVVVRITYVAELKVEGSGGADGNHAVRFLLPTAVAPRYHAHWSGGEAVVPSGPSHRVPNGLTFTLEANMSTPITSVVSPTHTIEVARVTDTTAPSTQRTTATVRFANAGAVTLGGDLVVLVQSERDESKIAQLVVEKNVDSKGAETHACMLTLLPNFELDDVRTDIVFVIDRSGSMAGSQIEQAKKAMQLFLRSLPTDCYFNIVGFGSRYETLFARPERYAQGSLNLATVHVQNLKANLGGTELLAPLQAIASWPVVAGYPRQVFVLTDGQVNNTDAVCAQVQSMNNTARFFSLGIGADVSHALVEGIARSGNGTAAFVHSGEAMETKVMKQMKQAIQPAITDVKIDWGELGGSSSGGGGAAAGSGDAPVKSLLGYRKPVATEGPILQSPYKVPPVFNGERFVVYALLKPGVAQPPTRAIVRAVTPDGPLEATVDVTPDSTVSGDIVHRLAARSLLRDIGSNSSCLHHTETGGFRVPSGDEIRSFAVAVGCRYKLASQYTSFVAVEERADAVPIPVQYSRVVRAELHQVRPTPMFKSMPGRPAVGMVQPAAAAGVFGSSSNNASASLSFGAGGGAASYDGGARGGSSRGADGGARGGSSRGADGGARLAASFGGGSRLFAGEAKSAQKKSARSGVEAARPRSAPQHHQSLSSSRREGAAMTDSWATGGGHSFDRSSREEECDSEDNFAGAAAAAAAPPPPSLASSLAPSSTTTAGSGPRRVGRDLLHALVPLQQFDGSFHLSADLATAAGVASSTLLSQAIPASLSTALSAAGQQAWATAVAIAILELILPELKEEWEMVADKSKAWLRRTLKGSGVDVESVMSQAKSVVSARV